MGPPGPQGISQGCSWRKNCPNLTLIPLLLSWNAGAPVLPAPQVLRVSRACEADLLAWGCRRGRVRAVIAAICSQLLPSPHGRAWASHSHGLLPLLGGSPVFSPTLGGTRSLSLCLIESDLEGVGLSLPGSLTGFEM